MGFGMSELLLERVFFFFFLFESSLAPFYELLGLNYVYI